MFGFVSKKKYENLQRENKNLRSMISSGRYENLNYNTLRFLHRTYSEKLRAVHSIMKEMRISIGERT